MKIQNGCWKRPDTKYVNEKEQHNHYKNCTAMKNTEG